jgi:hypothetical protein
MSDFSKCMEIAYSHGYYDCRNQAREILKDLEAELAEKSKLAELAELEGF